MPRHPTRRASAALRRTPLAALVVVVACSGEVAIYANDETSQLAASAARAKAWTPSAQDPVSA